MIQSLSLDIEMYLQKYGLKGLFIRILTKPFRTLIRFGRHLFQNYNYVYRYDHRSETLPIPEGFLVRSFAKIEEISDRNLLELNTVFGTEEIKTNMIAIKHRGCVMWVGYFLGNPVCIGLSRKASAIPYWFIKLNPDDVVIMRAKTAPGHRGRGFWPALGQAMIKHFRSNMNIGIYSDCSVHNKASMRMMEKMGFKIIGRKKAIKERWPSDI